MTDSTDKTAQRQTNASNSPTLLDESHELAAKDLRSKPAQPAGQEDLTLATAELFNSATQTQADAKTRGRALTARGADQNTESEKDAPQFPGKPQRLTADQMDIPTGTVTIAPGDSLPAIVQKWTKNSDVDATAYLSELMLANHLKAGEKLKPGRELDMPGHSKDGAFVVKTSSNDQKISWADGHQVVLHENSTGYSVTPTADGGTETVGWGNRPESNFDLIHQPTGDFRVKDSHGKLQDLYDNANVEEQREKLSRLADSQIKDPELLSKFHADMARFEARANDRQLNSTEVSKTYESIGRLLDKSQKTKWSLGMDDRTTLATQVMSQAATPTSIDQGSHDTCNVTAVEVRTYSLHPSNAANLISEVALSGTYHTPFPQPTGTLIHLNAKSLIPDLEASNNPPNDGERSYATQLFNVTAVNIIHARDRTSKVFVNDPDGGNDVLYSRKNHKSLGSKPDLSDDQIVRAYDLINRTSRATEPTVLIDAAKNVDGDGKYCTVIESQSDLLAKLKEAKENRQLPVILGVSANVEPFWTDSGHGSVGGSNGMHVVSVTDIDLGPPVKVSIDNQWGSKADHVGQKAVPLEQLFVAMHKPTEAANLLQKDVDTTRSFGILDPLPELELTRLRHFNKVGDIEGTDHGERIKAQQEYSNALVDLIHRIRDNYALETKQGRQIDENKTLAKQKISSIIDDPNILPPAQADVLTAAKASDLIETKDFNQQVASVMYQIGKSDEMPENATDTGRERFLFFKSQTPEGISKFTKLVSGLSVDDRRAIVDHDLTDDTYISAVKFSLLRVSQQIHLLDQNDFVQRAAQAIHEFRNDRTSDRFTTRQRKDEEKRDIREARKLLKALPPALREKIRSAEAALPQDKETSSDKDKARQLHLLDDLYSDAPQAH